MTGIITDITDIKDIMHLWLKQQCTGLLSALSLGILQFIQQIN